MTKNNDYPKPGESWMGFFYRKKKVAELILLAWAIAEFDINQLVSRQYGLFYTDKKSKFLSDMTFNKKLEFLKTQNALTKSQYEKIKKFQQMRNIIYHGKNHFWFIKSEKDQEEMMKVARDAAQAFMHALITPNKKK